MKERGKDLFRDEKREGFLQIKKERRICSEKERGKNFFKGRKSEGFLQRRKKAMICSEKKGSICSQKENGSGSR